MLYCNSILYQISNSDVITIYTIIIIQQYYIYIATTIRNDRRLFWDFAVNAKYQSSLTTLNLELNYPLS